MITHGWKEAPTMGEHFGRKLTKGVATVIFYRTPMISATGPCGSTVSAAI